MTSCDSVDLQTVSEDPLAPVRLVKAKVVGLVSKWPQVNGVGITRVGEKFAVKVNLSTPVPAGFDLPGSVDGVPVVVETVGPIRALAR